MQVEFELVRPDLAAEPRISNVTLLVRANQAYELGRVSMLKKNFGFIRCCDRVTDMFFHMNAVADGAVEPTLGADVKFVPVLQPSTGKVFATEVEVVEPGTAVFEIVGEETLEGSVRIVPGEARGTMPGPKGVIMASVGGLTETLPFSADDVVGDLPALHAKVRAIMHQALLREDGERTGSRSIGPSARR